MHDMLFGMQLAATLQVLAVVCHEHRFAKTCMHRTSHAESHAVQTVPTGTLLFDTLTYDVDVNVSNNNIRGDRPVVGTVEGTRRASHIPYINELVDIANLLVHAGCVDAHSDMVHACLLATSLDADMDLLRKQCTPLAFHIVTELHHVQRAQYDITAMRALSRDACTVLLAHIAYGADRIAARDTMLNHGNAQRWMANAWWIVRHIGPCNRELYKIFVDSYINFKNDKRE